MNRKILSFVFVLILSGILFAEIPVLKIQKYQSGRPQIVCMRERDPGIFEGKICLNVSVHSPGDFIQEKNAAFEWFILEPESETLIAESYFENGLLLGRVLVDERMWVENIMIRDPLKLEVGLAFSEKNTDGENVKLGFWFKNPGKFKLEFRVKKYFSDQEENLYFGIWQIRLGPVVKMEFSHETNGKTFYNGILEFTEIKLIESNFPDIEPEPEPECTGDITVTCEDGTVITTYKCVDGKLVETGEKCPDPQPEPEEEKKSLLIRIIEAILNFFKSIFS